MPDPALNRLEIRCRYCGERLIVLGWGKVVTASCGNSLCPAFRTPHSLVGEQGAEGKPRRKRRSRASAAPAFPVRPKSRQKRETAEGSKLR